MRTYGEFRPTGFDQAGLGLDDRQDWLVAPVGTNRDADVVTRSNWEVVTADIREAGAEAQEIHRFGHWGPGWFEICLVRPGSGAAECARDWEAALADYPVASDDHLSELAMQEANEAWQHERTRDRLEYIRRNRSEFEFRCFSDLLSCARGKYFAGDALSYVGGY
jgi:hypothetical protein